MGPEYLDVSLPPGKSFTHRTPRGHTVFAYVIGGNLFDTQSERLIGDGHLVSFGDGDQVAIAAKNEAVRFLLISGKPIGESIAWQGPIVMNTQEELQQAFEDLERGTFIRGR